MLRVWGMFQVIWGSFLKVLLRQLLGRHGNSNFWKFWADELFIFYGGKSFSYINMYLKTYIVYTIVYMYIFWRLLMMIPGSLSAIYPYPGIQQPFRKWWFLFDDEKPIYKKWWLDFHGYSQWLYLVYRRATYWQGDELCYPIHPLPGTWEHVLGQSWWKGVHPQDTPQKTNMEIDNWWFVRELPFPKGGSFRFDICFRGAFSFGTPKREWFNKLQIHHGHKKLVF